MTATELDLGIETATTYRREYGKGHQYFLDGHKVPGVTSLISAGFPKNLAKWGADTVANKAIDEWPRLARMPVSLRLKTLASAPWSDRDNAAVRGTRIHTIAEQLINGEHVSVPADIAGHVNACREFLSDWQVKPIAVESAVFSRKHGYAGTADLFAHMGDGKTRLLDYKTSRSGIWGDIAFQLAAYRYAEFMLDDSGQEIPIPEVDGCAGIWLTADGYEVYPIEVTKAVFREFLAVKQVAEAVDNSKFYKGDPMGKPVSLA
jgi:hypothetical protein